MSKNPNRQSQLFLLHIIVFIWGFTGILGKVITLSSFALVWWRVMIATIFIGAFVALFKKKIGVTPKEFFQFFAIGLLTAAHWVCFFASIKESNISVALAVISTTSFFVAIISPLVRKEKMLWYEIILGLIVVLGLYLIFHFEAQYTKGIILSLLAALLAATFSSYNSLLVQRHSATKMAFWEMLSALFGITFFFALNQSTDWEKLLHPGVNNMGYLLILGVICTAVAFIVSIDVMKVLSPFTVALSINLEPVYTIGLAVLIFGESEYMSPQFYIGAIILISTLFINAYLKRDKLKQVRA
jgi:drug/metabolite transporter (DMT)-like permease